ncbi:hypothetical protein JCM24511_06216 [Saitozyma sp. JCM 24511]|nr:hypothetical protein JCM24511_06216 [Saitozyma sp. JCM 24511]
MPDVSALRDRSVDGHLSLAQLPVVDIAPYLDASSTKAARKATSESLDRACREFGFFYVTGHGLSPSYLDSLLALGHRFFDLPMATKESIHIFKSQDGVRGYQRIGENVTYAKRDQQEVEGRRRSEEGRGKREEVESAGLDCSAEKPASESDLTRVQALDIYPEPEVPSSAPLEGSQQWPADEDIPGFKAAVLEYTEKMVLRVIGYPPLPASFDTDTGISCGAHTDYGCLTFLLADPTPGALQVEAKDGSWIPADPVPGAFVVNIGDIIDTLTGHQYKSTYHRVIHRGENYRVSIPFFFEPMRDMVIKPFAEMIPPGVTVEPFTYFDHLKASQVPLHFKCCTALVLYHTSMIYRHFVANDQALPDKPNSNELTNRG